MHEHPVLTTSHHAHRRAGALLALTVAVATQGSIACGSNRNHEQREAYAATLPNDDPPGCLYLCQPDPPPKLVDCQTPVAGLEFLEVWTFNGTNAPYLYTYSDRSVHNLNVHGWEPPTEGTVRCQGVVGEAVNGDGEPIEIEGLDRAFHLKGGPFRDWGGGFGMRLQWLLEGPDHCAKAERPDYCQPPDTPPPFDQYTFDLTSYDGISFWARRGPDSQPLLRVMIGDRRTDDDISYRMSVDVPEEPRFCERNLKCGCPKDLPCTPAPEGMRATFDPNDRCGGGPVSVCWDPEKDPYGDQLDTYQFCGDDACNCGYEAYPEEVDPEFEGKTCNRFAFRGGIVDDYCYDPVEGPPPYESNYLCGDHWTYPVHLTTEWQFFKVPFTKLLQQGWAKEQHQFDLNYVSMLRFSWDKGYIDYWIDDVGFYRDARPAEP